MVDAVGLMPRPVAADNAANCTTISSATLAASDPAVGLRSAVGYDWNMLMHGALKVAKEQFLSDHPGREVADCFVIGNEPDRYLVLIFATEEKLGKEPVALYAVSRDLKSVVRWISEPDDL
jgi:hypothetical protein